MGGADEVSSHVLYVGSGRRSVARAAHPLVLDRGARAGRRSEGPVDDAGRRESGSSHLYRPVGQLQPEWQHSGSGGRGEADPRRAQLQALFRVGRALRRILAGPDLRRHRGHRNRHGSEDGRDRCAGRRQLGPRRSPRCLQARPRRHAADDPTGVGANAPELPAVRLRLGQPAARRLRQRPTAQHRHQRARPALRRADGRASRRSEDPDVPRDPPPPAWGARSGDRAVCATAGAARRRPTASPTTTSRTYSAAV